MIKSKNPKLGRLLFFKMAYRECTSQNLRTDKTLAKLHRYFPYSLVPDYLYDTSPWCNTPSWSASVELV